MNVLILMLFAIPHAHAQSPFFTMEDFSAPNPFPAQFRSLDELNQWKDKNTKTLDTVLNQVKEKYRVLDSSNLAYAFITPLDRESATLEIISETKKLPAPKFFPLQQCIETNVLNLKNCSTEAKRIYSDPDIQKNPRLVFLLEGMVFRNLDDLLQLQAYKNKLKSLMNQYEYSIFHAPEEIKKAEEDIINQDPAYLCTEKLGTIRLDQDSFFQQKPVPSTMKNILVQDQGELGTCFANSASTLIESIHGKAVSALDLAVRYLYQNGKKETASVDVNDFGGAICDTIQMAKNEGACPRENSWMEQGLVKLNSDSSEPYYFIEDTNQTKHKGMQLLNDFYKMKSHLSMEDLNILQNNAYPLMVLLRSTLGQKIPEPIESPFTYYLKFSLQFITKPDEKTSILNDLSHLDLNYLYDFNQEEKQILRKKNAMSDEAFEKASDQMSDQIQAKYRPIYETVLTKHLPSWSAASIHQYFNPYFSEAAVKMTSPFHAAAFIKNSNLRLKVTQRLNPFFLTSGDHSQLEEILILSMRLISDKTFNENQNALNPEKMVTLMFQNSVETAFKYFIAPNCDAPTNRIPLERLSCESKYLKNTPASLEEKTHVIREDLIRSLQRGIPLGISYCSEALDPNATPGKTCSSHASLLTGIRFNAEAQRCEVMVWNSWGKQSGKTWIDEQRLAGFLNGIDIVTKE